MKKLISYCLCLLMLFTIVGCSKSTKDQEKTINSFFECFKNGEISQVKNFCTDDIKGIEQLTSMSMDEKELDEISKSYGKKFANEAKEFFQDAYKSMIVSYEITKIEKQDDNYVAVVNVVMKNTLEIKISDTIFSARAQDYMTIHESELTEIMLTEGEQAVLEKVAGQVAEELFNEMRDQMDDIKEIKATMTFNLNKENDKWLIKTIKSDFK